MIPVVDKLRDGSLFARAWFTLATIEITLRRHGYEAVLSAIERDLPAEVRVMTNSDIRRAQRYSRRIDEAARVHPVRARCLHRSLALHHWLRREGLPSTLRLGVRTAGGELFAHAWVELAGQPVNDLPVSVSAYVPLTRQVADQRLPAE